MNIIFIVLLIVAAVVFIVKKIVNGLELNKNNKNEQNIEHEQSSDNAPPSMLDFLVFNNADGVRQEYGTIVLNEILTSYSNHDIPLTECIYKLRKEGFQYDDVIAMIENHINNLEENDTVLKEEINQEKAEKNNITFKQINKKKSSKKILFMIMGVLLFSLLLFIVLSNVSKLRLNNQKEEVTAQLYYYEMFIVHKDHYFSITEPVNWNFNTMNDYRNQLRNSLYFRLLYSTAEASENDLYSIFTTSGYTPNETNEIISYINSIGSNIFIGDYLEDINYVHVAYFEIIKERGWLDNINPRINQDNVEPSLKMTLIELVNAYRANRTEANSRYNNRNIVISGSITSIAANPPRIVFELGLEDFPIDDFLRGGLLGSIYSIVMVFDNQDASMIENLLTGNLITVEGRFNGLNDFNNLQMNNCKILPTYMYVNTDILNIMRSPSSNSTIIGELARNTRVQILDTTGQWWKIRVAQFEGYINPSHIISDFPPTISLINELTSSIRINENDIIGMWGYFETLAVLTFEITNGIKNYTLGTQITDGIFRPGDSFVDVMYGGNWEINKNKLTLILSCYFEGEEKILFDTFFIEDYYIKDIDKDGLTLLYSDGNEVYWHRFFSPI